MSATVVPLRFQVGARTLAQLPRRLHRVALSLDDALAGAAPSLPPLARGVDGYLVTSLPDGIEVAAPGLLRAVRQRYRRYGIDLSVGTAGYWAQMSANARASLRRKRRRLEAAGAVEVQAFRTAEEVAAFHPVARRLAERTYQERMMGAGIPGDAGFVAEMLAAAAADRVRAWLLSVDGRPAAYLYCPAEGETLRYEYLGYDPDFAELSPGAVLQIAALEQLFEERRFARFDFTEGEGQHKRQFATIGVDCHDLLLLRPTFANRLALGALQAFDRLVAAGAQAARHPRLRPLADRLRRG